MPPPPADDDDIPVEEEDILEETTLTAPAQLRSVPQPGASKPALSVVPPPARPAPAHAPAGDGGEALLRDALSKASREVIERIAWEVVPELAETIIREELERLLKERGA
jgi:hypothetical protein